MSVDRAKLLDSARRYVARNQFDKAIAAYQKLVEHDPNDVRSWLQIGDLLTREGRRRDASEAYGRVARHYAQCGFFLKAVAVYKQILKLEPARVDTLQRLAEMYEKLELTSDAMNVYEQVVDLALRRQDERTALEALQSMCDLDPENLPVRIKYAEALSRAGKTEAAADAFEVSAFLLKDRGRLDDYVKVVERLLFHRPTATKFAKEMAAIYIERSDPKRALAKLQACFKADPHDIETLGLLARAFEKLAQKPKAISVYREIARIHQKSGNAEARALALKRILDLDPQDAEARQGLAAYAPKANPLGDTLMGMPATAAKKAQDEPEIEVLEASEEEEIALADDEFEEESTPVPQPKRPAAPPRPRIPTPSVAKAAKPRTPSLPAPSKSSLMSRSAVLAGLPGKAPAGPARSSVVPPDVAREAQIARLLTECDVFTRYGLKAKVIGQLEKVLELEPKHAEARERLAGLYAETGKNEKAADIYWSLAQEQAAKDPKAAQRFRARAVELDPAKARLDQEEKRAAAKAPAPALPARDDKRSAELLGIPPSKMRPVASPPTAASKPASGPLRPPPAPPSSLRRSPPLPSAAKAEAKAESAHSTSGPTPMAPPPLFEMGDGLDPMSPQEFDAVPVRSLSPKELHEAQARRKRRHSVEIEEVMDEADFFTAQGLWDEAQATLQEALLTHPGHPLVVEKLNEIEESRASAPLPAPQRRRLSQEDQAYLLAQKLAEELDPELEETGGEMIDVETVFAEFKKGVKRQIAEDDSDTHFDLGIAYKEMGLLDDAIHEFELSMSNPRRECLAYTMIGLCQIEKGAVAEAITNFKRGLYADLKTEHEVLGLYFELGVAYELLQDQAEALYYYQKVFRHDPTFRDVPSKIRALSARGGGTPRNDPGARL